MGHGIALVAAQAGYHVRLYDLETRFLKRAEEQLEAFTQKSVAKGKLTAEQRMETLGRIRYTPHLDDLNAEFILEAIPEKLALKQQVFQQLEEHYGPQVVLASNTSSIPITAIAGALKHPERVVGMHFFNPAPLMKLVEVIAGAATDPHYVSLTEQLSKKLNKTPAMVADAPGFIVNRVARFYYLEALKTLEEGGLQPEQMDRILEGTGFRMGPFRLMDLIGVETNHSVTRTIYHAFYEEPRFRPSRLQQKKVEAGHFGRKTKRGWYSYEG